MDSFTDPRDFREYAWLLSPGTWRGYWGERLTGWLGLMWDMVAEGAQNAVLVSKIGSRNYPADALELHGLERMLPRFPGESDANYQTRLKDAWDIWREAGTVGGIKELFTRWGGKSIEIWTQHGISTVNWDGDYATNWSRIWILIMSHPWSASPVLGNPAGPIMGDAAATLGTTATPDDVRAARNIVRSFKEAHAVCVSILVVLDPVDLLFVHPPNGTWNNVANRTLAARYWDG